PSASWLGRRHPREPFRQPRPDVPNGGGREGLDERVVARGLPRVRVHVSAQCVLLPFRPRVRVPVEIEMDLRGPAEVTGAPQDCHVSPDESDGQAGAMRGDYARRPVTRRDDDPLAGKESLPADLDALDAARSGSD